MFTKFTNKFGVITRCSSSGIATGFIIGRDWDRESHSKFYMGRDGTGIKTCSAGRERESQREFTWDRDGTGIELYGIGWDWD